MCEHIIETLTVTIIESLAQILQCQNKNDIFTTHFKQKQYANISNSKTDTYRI